MHQPQSRSLDFCGCLRRCLNLGAESEAFCTLLERDVLRVRCLDNDAVGKRFPIVIHVNKTDETVEQKVIVAVIQHLYVGHKARFPGKNDLALKPHHTAVTDGFFEQHTVDIRADDVFRFRQEGRSDEPRFDEPHGRLPGEQRPMVVQIVTFYKMVYDVSPQLHSSSPFMSEFPTNTWLPFRRGSAGATLGISFYYKGSASERFPICTGLKGIFMHPMVRHVKL